MKSNLEDLYLNIKQCILILLKNYTIWSHNLVLLLLKKRTLFSKIPAVSAHESKSSAAVPNFGRGFNRHQLFWRLLYGAFERDVGWTWMISGWHNITGWNPFEEAFLFSCTRIFLQKVFEPSVYAGAPVKLIQTDAIRFRHSAKKH